jgi:hypothetical protein
MEDDGGQRFEIVKQRLLSGTTIVMLTVVGRTTADLAVANLTAQLSAAERANGWRFVARPC